ncbi:hypothetical protein DFH07DRAFT_969869 [Mycena maculata]|uniref:CxC2-like cysteine cluster KDZ transposase-associated domain-containing protein n=1 Tax=Mycena maculata TaxID=230809 RepID=A0AAD7HVB2_9AGAR|nr:hypothetical protein DFH07DRAFT_969869 [Mycena maculata]
MAHTHHVCLRTLDPPLTQYEAIPAFMDRTSTDNRRVYREEIAVQPPSPVKKMRTSKPSTLLPIVEESPAEPFSFDLYEMEGAAAYNAPPKPKVFKLSDDALMKWMPRRDDYVEQFLWAEGTCGVDVDVCPGCQGTENAPRFRCRDCRGKKLYCPACIVSQHKDNPLHNILRWNVTFFVKTMLAVLGLRIQFGHEDDSICTAPEAANKGFVVLHTNAIHEVHVDFCGCEQAPEAGTPEIQLLRAGWFPTTNERPQTCATFETLDDFVLLTHQAKTTMYDYYAVLEKKTDNTGIKPPDRYHEWAYDESGVEGTKEGALAIRCPGCPRPGVNLPEDWEDATEEDWWALVYVFLALDACFRLKRRLISSELKDPGLGVGMAYMLKNEPYREYLRTVTDQKEMNTCSGLAALDYANTKFSRGYATTGVGMGVCARHEFIQPNGVGDLQRGERFANMDYIFGSIMRHVHPRLRKLISYDIMCIWKKFLKERMANLPNPAKLTVILALFKFVIPKMHIHSHTLLCQLLYSLNLIPGSAQVDGEGIECPWASIGGVATSTVLMGAGARHGVLDCQWSHWNWQKLVGFVAMLRKRMERAKEELPVQRAAFDMFSAEQADHVPLWKRAVHDFEADAVNNPYEVKVKGMTEAQVRLQFSELEAADAARGLTPVHGVSASKFLTIGLEIEEEQRRVRVQALLKKAKTTAMKIDLGAMRTRLTHRVNQFRKLQATYMPTSLQVLGGMTITEDEVIENMPLLLPSALNREQREGAGCMAGLGNMEEMMRDAQCRTALERLRTQLNYQVAWEAIRRLIPSGDGAKVGWQQLTRDDVRCMEDDNDIERNAARRNAQVERARRKRLELLEHGLLPAEQDDEWEGMDEEGSLRVPENRRRVSWIWTVAGAGSSDLALEDELRIEWSKAYARLRRWTEEKSLLETEYGRFGLSMDYEAERWETRVLDVPVGVLARPWAEAAVGYAKRQAEMYRDLKRRGEQVWMVEKTKRGKKKPRHIPESVMVDDEEERERREKEAEEDEEEGGGGESSESEDEGEDRGEGQAEEDEEDEAYIMDGIVVD